MKPVVVGVFPSPHLSVQQRHGDVAVDVAPPRAQGGELHGGGRGQRGGHGGRERGGQLELVAAAEVPHLGRRGAVPPAQWQGHLVVVGDLRRQGNLKQNDDGVVECESLEFVHQNESKEVHRHTHIQRGTIVGNILNH